MKPKILVITPIDSIRGVRASLERAGQVTYWPDPVYRRVLKAIHRFDAVFTNPNKSKVPFSRELLKRAVRLKVICTASTGTNHIDKTFARRRGIRVLSLTEERRLINRIHSTAELALGLLLAGLRRIPAAQASVKKGVWDYEPFIGRQLDRLTVGIVGYGRLGRRFAHYALALGARVLVYDPNKKVRRTGLRQVPLRTLLGASDALSLHVHVTPETEKMVDERWFSNMKKNVVIVNTSRGEIVDERALLKFLKKNRSAVYATDVLSNEMRGIRKNPVFRAALKDPRILITPHIGGMTEEAREMAYTHAARMLRRHLRST